MRFPSSTVRLTKKRSVTPNGRQVERIQLKAPKPSHRSTNERTMSYYRASFSTRTHSTVAHAHINETKHKSCSHRPNRKQTEEEEEEGESLVVNNKEKCIALKKKPRIFICCNALWTGPTRCRRRCRWHHHHHRHHCLPSLPPPLTNSVPFFFSPTLYLQVFSLRSFFQFFLLCF